MDGYNRYWVCADGMDVGKICRCDEDMPSPWTEIPGAVFRALDDDAGLRRAYDGYLRIALPESMFDPVPWIWHGYAKATGRGWPRDPRRHFTYMEFRAAWAADPGFRDKLANPPEPEPAKPERTKEISKERWMEMFARAGGF